MADNDLHLWMQRATVWSRLVPDLQDSTDQLRANPCAVT